MKLLKVTVKKKFLDKYTGVMHSPGKVLTITDRRYREIKRSGDFVELEKAEKKPEAKKVEKAEKPELNK